MVVVLCREGFIFDIPSPPAGRKLQALQSRFLPASAEHQIRTLDVNKARKDHVKR